MKNDELIKIRILQKRIDDNRKIQMSLETKIQELMSDENVKKYIQLTEEYADFDDDMELFHSEILKIEKKECLEDGHRVLFCFDTVNYDYEGKRYYYCQCLNCGEQVKTNIGNLERYRIIDGRNYVNVADQLVLDIINNANREYHLLKERYYKYPEILKETEKQDEIIYKVMRKRYETRDNS